MEEEDAVAASQAHKFGSLLAIERIARKEAKYSPKMGFFSSPTSTAFPAAVPGPGTGVSNFVAEIIGQEQQRHESGRCDGIFLAPNRMLRLFTP